MKQPTNPRVTVQEVSRAHAYIKVDGNMVCTVTDMDLYEAILAAVEGWAVCAKGAVNQISTEEK